MDKQEHFSTERYPPTDQLAAAIKNLPRASPAIPPQTVDIDAGPAYGRFRVTFVVRQNPGRGTPTWFWGVESSERTTPPASGGTSVGGPPDSGTPGGSPPSGEPPSSGPSNGAPPRLGP
jgi:hypothetical protein